MPTEPVSSEFKAAFLARSGEDGALSFADFMDLALYRPGFGYYRRARPRVGPGGATDFHTATTSAPLFGRLVQAACAELLPPFAGRPPPGLDSFEWIEIGAEPGSGLLPGTRGVRLQDPLQFGGACIVVSNELFDAQPFRRFVARDGCWRERGVKLAGDRLVEVELPASAIDFTRAPKPPGSAFHPGLPASAPEGYAFDAPFASVALLRRIAALSWTGLFVAFDYGKSWAELAEHTPEGTARAYRRHLQTNDLLAAPGEQDLTCHVCWDWLSAALSESGFSSPRVESQEAFFVHHAGRFIERALAAAAGRLSPEKLSLLQLLHPANLGQKFQVLWAVRN